ncbi:MAG: type II toxin-antitoxin system HicB family antitoxin [Ruminococcaceae bacterium]|nr:type II toxin-antitoxin system HicB family antitoxin [Oscillospiraceae bacterium]
MKYVYPAIFTEEENGYYSVRFDDVDGCFTSGKGIEEAMDMAKDALCLMLYELEEKEEKIPDPSDIRALHYDSNEFVSLIQCDTIEYRKFFNNKAVKKTLSIPAWLNEMAEKKDINFSATLQSALKQQLNIE